MHPVPYLYHRPHIYKTFNIHFSCRYRSNRAVSAEFSVTQISRFPRFPTRTIDESQRASSIMFVNIFLGDRPDGFSSWRAHADFSPLNHSFITPITLQIFGNIYISLPLIKLTFIKYPLLTVEQRALLSSVVYRCAYCLNKMSAAAAVGIGIQSLRRGSVVFLRGNGCTKMQGSGAPKVDSAHRRIFGGKPSRPAQRPHAQARGCCCSS